MVLVVLAPLKYGDCHIWGGQRQAADGVQFGGHRIGSLLFASDVALAMLRQLTAKCVEKNSIVVGTGLESTSLVRIFHHLCHPSPSHMTVSGGFAGMETLVLRGILPTEQDWARLHSFNLWYCDSGVTRTFFCVSFNFGQMWHTSHQEWRNYIFWHQNLVEALPQTVSVEKIEASIWAGQPLLTCFATAWPHFRIYAASLI